MLINIGRTVINTVIIERLCKDIFTITVSNIINTIIIIIYHYNYDISITVLSTECEKVSRYATKT